MSNVIENICRLRDIIENKDYKRLAYSRKIMTSIFEEIHRHLGRKAQDYKYELDFTAQDLRELAQDIRNMFKRWDNVMCPEKNIKELTKNMKDNTIDFDSFSKKVIPYMEYRRDNVYALIELLSLLEYHSVYLYYLELASNDEFAIKCTQRLT
jgi:hypothetical protein